MTLQTLPTIGLDDPNMRKRARETTNELIKLQNALAAALTVGSDGSLTATGSLAVSGSLTVTGMLSLSADLSFSGQNTPAQITADQNDYTAGGFILTRVAHRLSSDASRSITGLDRDGSGHFRIFMNVGAQNIVLVHESGSSAANKRFNLPGAANYTIGPSHGCTLLYDGTSDRWRVVAGTQ